ncbi:4281_t:CDS:2, partial [Cetraspora pellucida]
MLKEESKLDERNKDSLVSVDSPCISIPMVPSNLESNKLEPKEEVKNKKSNVKALLEEVLTDYDTLSWKVNQEKEIKPYTSAALEPEDLVLDLTENYSFKKDEQLGIKKDEHIRIEKVESYLVDSVLVEGLEGYSNSDDNVDTALKKIHRRNSKPKIVIDCESLHEACKKWKEKSRDQRPRGEKNGIVKVTVYNTKLTQVFPLNPGIVNSVLNDGPKGKKKQ